MDFGGLSGRLAAVAGFALLAACTYDDEPTKQCGSLDLRASHNRVEPGSAPTVVALSDGAGRVRVLRTCEGSDCVSAELISQTIELGQAPDQIMLTASGRWLTYRVGPNLFRLDLEAESPAPEGGPGQVHELIGSLRGGDWLIYRTWGGVDPTSPSEGSSPPPVNESELWAYYAGDMEDLPEDPDPDALQLRPRFRIGGDLDLRVVAMGHRHIVARRMVGDDREELYLVRIAPARRHDALGTSSRGKPLLLARGPSFSRVLITEGPSPAEHGDPWEFQHEVPTDVQVIATAGSGSGAHTLIYAVSDTAQVARFNGAVVTSLLPLDDVAGVSAVSPDGSHLAYLTPRSSLALRNLNDQSSCMVRPASGTQHVLAGFGADGTLYFEAEEQGTDRVTNKARRAEVVYAYDTIEEVFEPLTSNHRVWRLKAVPSQRYRDEDGEQVPWAVVASDGFHAARAHQNPQELAYDEVSFFTRGDETLWLIEGEPGDGFGDVSRLSLRRVQPLVEAGELSFDDEGADPSVKSGDFVADRFSHSYSPTARVCVSTSQSASQTTPWASQCSTVDEPTHFLDNGVPAGERQLY